MNIVAENLQSSRNVVAGQLRYIVGSPNLRNFLGFCLFVVAFYYACRYGMWFSHASSSPFWFSDSVLLAVIVARVA